jgi:hypothetical protein
MRKSVLLAAILIFALSPAVITAQDKNVEITRLGVAPWLGEIRDQDDLAAKFAKEDKEDFIRYIRYDLEQAVNLDITEKEAAEVVNSMAAAIRQAERISVPNKTIFKSMGWRSKVTGKIMRTPNPILKLGKETQGFLFSLEVRDYRLEYVFLQVCGNLCLYTANIVQPAKAEDVPQDPQEKVAEPAAPSTNLLVLLVNPSAQESPPPSPQPKAFPSVVLGGGAGIGTSDEEFCPGIGAGFGLSPSGGIGGLAPALCGRDHPWAIGIGIGGAHRLSGNIFLGIGMGGYYSGSYGIGIGVVLGVDCFSSSSSSRIRNLGIGFAHHFQKKEEKKVIGPPSVVTR